MNPCELISLVTALSCAIANCVPREELPLVAAIFSQISSTLVTFTAQDELINQKEAAPAPEATPPDAALITTPPGA
jgi:hypothetical protein